MRVRWPIVILLVAACSSGDGDRATSTPATNPGTVPATTATPTVPEPTAPASTTTEAAPVEPVDRSAPGGYPVGVTTLGPAGGPAIEVWYPAVAGTTGSVAYDVRDLIPPAVSELLTADLPATFVIDGQRGAAVAEGRFPVVLFSHGYSGFRQQSSFLTAHLASHGMVVVAPDHAGRDLFHVLSGLDSADPAADVAELLGALDVVRTDAAFRDHVDDGRVAAIGHSAGGGTVQRVAAADARVDGVVVMAAGAPDRDGEGSGVPSLFLAGAVDGVVSAATDTRPAFERATTPSWYWELDGVGHNGFSDLCTIGGGTGIIGLAEASGLGPVLDAQPQLRALGEDGCVPPAVPVDTTFPPIRHAATAWLRWLFGEDPEPVGLDPVPGSWPVEITALHRAE